MNVNSMSENKKDIVDFDIIYNMLYNDMEAAKEFVVASIDSFSEFNQHFGESMKARNLEKLRNAGHKIKPVAQMLQLDEILNIYEEAKDKLVYNAAEPEIDSTINQMNTFCTRLLSEFEEFV